MQELIKQSEDIVTAVKSLNYGDRDALMQIKDTLRDFTKAHVPENHSYQDQLKEIDFPEKETLQQDLWQEHQQNLLQLAQGIHQDILKKHKAYKQETSSQEQIETLQKEVDKMKNDYEKDLILERNNHQYLKKKYEILKIKHEQMERQFQQVLGSKRNWNIYLLLVFPLVFVVLFFDTFFPLSFFGLLRYQLLVKTSVSFSLISGLLYIPLKNRLLILLAFFFLLIALLLQEIHNINIPIG